MNAPAQPRSLVDWLRCFGPGAILASLTIGVGELVFSTRAGALFGYRLLWFFALILFFKWLLVYSTARHIAITGAHPFQRWMELPGPRGWFVVVFGLLAVIAFPIWVAFHSATLGTLLAAKANGSAHFGWGLGFLAIATALSFAGGYKTLERAQVAIVAVMLLSVLAAFFWLQPNWAEFLVGLLLPRGVIYPDWAREITELKSRPVWLETITYVGIIGGSGYDYLAYVSYVRDKGWRRESLKVILFDSILSFLAVLIFTAVFTSLGALILRPQHQIPTGSDLLTLQTQFVTPIFPALRYLYFAGAFLAVFGTLYGTIEVAPAIAREMMLAFRPDSDAAKTRRPAVGWVCFGGAVVLLVSLFNASGTPPSLVALLTPANLFTGVLACGCVCLLSVWADYKWLAREDRLAFALVALNVIGGVTFLALGLKGYLDQGIARAATILTVTLFAGFAAARLLNLGTRD